MAIQQQPSRQVTAPPINDLAYMSDTDLRTALKEAVSMTAHAIAKAARIWAEMDRRGIDLSEYRKSLHSYLPLVAKGKLLPDSVVEFMGEPAQLKLFSALPLDEQLGVLKRGTLPIYDGLRQRERLVPLSELDLAQMECAIDAKAGRLRPLEQQKAIAVIAKPEKPAAQPAAQMMHLVVDRSVGARVRLAAEAASLSVSEYLAELLPATAKKK